MYFDSDSEGPWFRDADTHPDGCNTDYGSWELCGPILEEHNITVERWDEEHEWKADQAEAFVQYGGTYLEAAMRCYVASKLGDEVDIPEELT
jgi:mannose-1-phosphate guanylyltransferase